MDELATVGLPDLSKPVCDIIAAYVSHNHVARIELPALIASVHTALSALNSDHAKTSGPLEKPSSAQIRKSITPDALISFIDGKPYKTLKRHLSTHGFDPDSYRAQFGLPGDYPMVAPTYSQRRSELARSHGLGEGKGFTRKAKAATAAPPSKHRIP